MSENLFQGLPPPSAPPTSQQQQHSAKESFPNPPPRILKSALKRTKPPESQPEATAPEKRLRFKTTTDASETQVIEAMQKIASHIKNPTKFCKASKLAIQLVQAGSVKPGTSVHFFAILEAAMSSATSCNDPSVRADYHALFSAAQDAVECLNKKQSNQLASWVTRAVTANDLFTDDSFVVLGKIVDGENVKCLDRYLVKFSRTAGRIKEAISNLPVATEEEDREEAAALKHETEVVADVVDSRIKQVVSSSVASADEGSGNDKESSSDPFGLDALIPSTVKKDEKSKVKKDATAKIRKEEEEEQQANKRFLKSQRQALILCLDIAARRYKTPWCQTVIDILVKNALDNISRFTAEQRVAIEKLWNSIREQLNRRKQGKSVSGKLDVNAFEWLQEKYANEKISIRHSVGGGGDRRAQQWLG